MGYQSERRERKRAKRGQNIGLFAGIIGSLAQSLIAQKQKGEADQREQLYRDSMLELKRDELGHKREYDAEVLKGRSEAIRSRERIEENKAKANQAKLDADERRAWAKLGLDGARHDETRRHNRAMETKPGSAGGRESAREMEARGMAARYGNDPQKIQAEIERLEGIVSSQKSDILDFSHAERVKSANATLVRMYAALDRATRAGGSDPAMGPPAPPGMQTPPPVGTDSWESHEGQGIIEHYRNAMSPNGDPEQSVQSWLRLQRMFPTMGRPPNSIMDAVGGNAMGNLGASIGAMGSMVMPYSAPVGAGVGAMAGKAGFESGAIGDFLRRFSGQ